MALTYGCVAEQKFAVEGASCEITRHGTAKLLAWAHPDGLPGYTYLSAPDLAAILLMCCNDDHGEALRVLGRVMSDGHRFDDPAWRKHVKGWDDIDPF